MMEETSLSLRAVGDAEIPLFAAITMAALPGVHTDAQEYAKQLARETADRRAMSILARCGDRAVGRMRLQSFGESATAWGLGLTPEATTQGLAPLLLAALERHARGAGVRRLILELDSSTSQDVHGAALANGYRTRKRRVTMWAAVERRAAPCDRVLRHPLPGDAAEAQALAQLMYDAYWNTIDYDGETPDAARDEVRRLYNDEYGLFLPGCSYVLPGDDGQAGGAALVTREAEDHAFLAEVMIHPCYRGRGYARPLIQAAMNACLDAGFPQMGLVVTLGNVPAEGLYRRLGFVEEPGGEQHHVEKDLA